MPNLEWSPLLNKYSLANETIIDIGDSILNNHLIVKYNYIPSSIDTIIPELQFHDNFGWELNMHDHNNMAMLHLHALEPVSYLLLAYTISEKEEYLDKSLEITLSWSNHAAKSDHFYLWYRHCVSDRSIVLSSLYSLISISSRHKHLKEKILSIMNEHKSYLIDSDNYTLHNHGTLVDMGLLSLSIVTNDEQIIKFSRDRLRSNFLDTFTENMICVENSISYSIYNIDLFIKSEKYLLAPCKYSIDAEFDSKICKMLDFLDIVKKPDNTFPNLGDGEKYDLKFLKQSSIYKYYSDHILFSLKQANVFKVFPEEGYVIVRKENDYIFITAGDVKKNHKHADDLSFILSYDGKDVLVDSGMYNYTRGPIRDYQKSVLAHNTLMLNNTSYPYLKTTKEDVRILSYEETDTYYFVAMINKSYKFGNIIRHYYVLKNDFSVLIYDLVKSVSKISASQIYNLSPSYILNDSIEINENIVNLSENVKIISDTSSVLNIGEGNNAGRVNGIYSEKFHHQQSINQIRFNKFDQDPNILTLITRKDDVNMLRVIGDKEKYKIQLKLGQKQYRLKAASIDYEWVDTDKCYFEYSMNGNLLNGITIGNVFEEQEFSWDILKNSKKIHNIWYQESNEIEFTFLEKGVYKIRSYIRSVKNPKNKIAFTHDREIIIK